MSSKTKAIVIIVIVAGGLAGVLLAVHYLGGEDGGVVESNYVDVSQIAYVSKFRSCSGHEYYSDTDTGTSNKHYFIPIDSLDDTNDKIKTYAIWDGEITELNPVTPCEFIPGPNEDHYCRGQHICIHSGPYDARYMHVALKEGLGIGSKVQAGDFIGYADTRGGGNSFDLAILTHRDNETKSFFELMPDSVFAEYTAVNSELTQSDFIFTLEEGKQNLCNDPNYVYNFMDHHVRIQRMQWDTAP